MSRSITAVTGIMMMIVAAMGAAHVEGAGWAKTYDGGTNIWGTVVTRTEDGGFITAGGIMNVFSGWGWYWSVQQYLIMKINDAGDLEWQKYYGNGWDSRYFTDIVQVEEGYIISGFKYEPETGYDVAIFLKINHEGDLLWERIYGYSQGDLVPSQLVAAGGGATAVGYVDYNGDLDFWAAKVNANGSLAWSRYYDHSREETGICIDRAGDDYIIAGYYVSAMGIYDTWVLLLEDNGTIKAQKNFSERGNEQVTSIKTLGRGKYVMTGFSDTPGAGSFDIFTVKFDMNVFSNPDFQNLYGLYGPDYGYAVDVNSSGQLLVAASAFMPWNGTQNGYILKLDPGNGGVLYSRGYGGWNDDGFYYVEGTEQNNFAVCGFTDSFPNTGYTNAWIMHLNPQGKITGDDSCMLLDRVDPTVNGMDMISPCIPIDSDNIELFTYENIPEFGDKEIEFYGLCHQLP